MQTRLILAIALLVTLLALSACAQPPSLVIDVRADSAAEMQAALAARLPALRPITTAVEPDGLWRKLSFPPDKIAVLGFATEAGNWRIPPGALAGDAPGPQDALLAPLAKRRLDRFLGHVRINKAVVGADEAVRPLVIAAHATRALATDIAAKRDPRAVFVRFDARAPGLPAYVADGVRDLVELAGPQAPAVVWVRDDNERRVCGLGENTEAVLGGKED
jgi:hypothetical protein